MTCKHEIPAGRDMRSLPWPEVTQRWSLYEFTCMVWGLSLSTANGARMYRDPADILRAMIETAEAKEEEHRRWAKEHGWLPPLDESEEEWDRMAAAQRPALPPIGEAISSEPSGVSEGSPPTP